MASQPYRPDPRSAYAPPPPLAFVPSSFGDGSAAAPLHPPPYAASSSSAGSFAASSYAPPPSFGGGFALPQATSYAARPTFGAPPSFDTEPPLLEELGIDLRHILRKTRSMLRPTGADASLCDDGDLAGPLVFAAALGATHLLVGKVNFGYIIGWSVLSMLALHWLVNMLAGPGAGIELYRCGSLLGYCLLPIVLFSAAAVLLPARSTAVWALGVCATAWSTATASSLLTAIVPGLDGQRSLVAYPCFLAYSLFALLTIG